jgi:DnaJ-class molecular chaperone
MRPIDSKSVDGSTSCPACSGKGLLPIRLDALPIPSWTEMPCQVCSGDGATPAGPAPERAEAA